MNFRSRQQSPRAIGARPAAPPAHAGRRAGAWTRGHRARATCSSPFAAPTTTATSSPRAALEKGAAAVVVERPIGRARLELVVPDTLARSAGSWPRGRGDQWGGTVVGVTGSAGKTTTKDVIAHLLAARHRRWARPSAISTTTSACRSRSCACPTDCRVAVLEIGMNHAGEIRALAAIAAARHRRGHQRRLRARRVLRLDRRRRARQAGTDRGAAARTGVAVLNADDPRVARFREVHPRPRR